MSPLTAAANSLPACKIYLLRIDQPLSDQPAQARKDKSRLSFGIHIASNFASIDASLNLLCEDGNVVTIEFGNGCELRFADRSPKHDMQRLQNLRRALPIFQIELDSRQDTGNLTALPSAPFKPASFETSR